MAIILEIKVIPSAGQQKWVLESMSRLKCFLKSPAEDGKANRELIKMLSDTLDINRSDIFIVSGLTSRLKRIKIDTLVSYNELLQRLGFEVQHGLF